MDIIVILKKLVIVSRLWVILMAHTMNMLYTKANQILKPHYVLVRSFSSFLAKMARRNFKSILLDGLISAVIVIISLRNFLFQGGYYYYSDQQWPLSTSIYPEGVFSPSLLTNGILSGGQVFTFTRDIISWPYYLMLHLNSNIQISERMFIFYSFMIYLAMCYIFAEEIYVALSKYSKTALPNVQKELFKFVLVIFLYSNFSAMNLNVDGGAFSDGLILISISISIVALISWEDGFVASLLTGALISLSALLDPDYLPMFFIAIFSATFVRGLMGRKLKRYLKRDFVSVIVSIPAVFYIVYALFLTRTPFGPSEINSGRVFSISEIAFASQNMNPFYPFLLLGHLWSTIVYAPPSILGLGPDISSIHSLMYPAQVLWPPGMTTFLWFSSVVFVPFICFCSLFFRTTKNLAIPASMLSLVAYVFTQVQRVSPLFQMEYYATNIPIVGIAIGTSFALPGHFINLIAASYYILISITIFNVLAFRNIGNASGSANFTPFRKVESFFREHTSRHALPRLKSSLKSKSYRQLIVVLILTLLLVSGWQAFDGSYFPDRAFPPYFGGNNIPNFAPFEPHYVPSSVIKVYDYIKSTNGTFNIYWPVGLGIADTGTIQPPAPTIPLPALSYLISNHLYQDILPYLQSQSVKFLVVDNLTYEASLFLYGAFGLSSYESVLRFFNSTPGLQLVLRFPGIAVYEVPDVSSLFTHASLLLNYDGVSQDYALSYSLLQSLGVKPVVTDDAKEGASMGIGTLNRTVNLISPGTLQSIGNAVTPSYSASPFQSPNSMNFSSPHYINSSYFPIQFSWNQNHSLGQDNYVIDNWTTSTWGGSLVNISLNDGLFTFNSSKGAYLTLDYNGPLTGQYGGLTIPNATNESVVETLQFSYRSMPGLNASIGTALIGENSTYGNTYFDESPIISNSTTWKTYKMSVIAPFGTEYFGFRIGGQFTGEWQLNDVNLSYVPIEANTLSPFGSVLHITKENITLSSFSGNGYALISGNGSVNGVPISSSKWTWSQFPVVNKLEISGNLTLVAVLLVRNSTLQNLMGNYVVYSVPASAVYILSVGGKSYPPHVTISGTNFYALPLGNNGKFTINLYEVNLLETLYYILYSYLFVIGIWIVLRRKRKISCATQSLIYL